MSAGQETIRILIVDDIAETRESLKKMLYFEADMEVVGTARNGQEAIELAGKFKPHVVLMDINMPGLDGISASRQITDKVPYAQIVMMSVQSETDYMRRSMAAGARDFLTKPFTMDEMIATVRRVYNMSAHLRTAAPERQAGQAEAKPVAPEAAGKLIAVYSPKGGVGCTTLAINAATAMTQIDQELTIAVVDCKVQFGDVKIALDMRAGRSILDLVDNIDELDRDLIESAMVRDDRSGLRALLAPPKPEQADLVEAGHVQTILERLKSMFDFVIVDMGSTLRELELAVFDQADRILLVATPDLPAITNVRNFFELMQVLGYSREMVLLVLNKSDSNTGLNARMIENHLKHQVFAEVPVEDRLVLHSVNHGIPYMIAPNADRRSPLLQKTGALAQQLMQVFAPKPRSGQTGESQTSSARTSRRALL
jgi:pilus assembly protein CpaE